MTRGVATLALAVVTACAHTPDLPLRLDPDPPAGSTTEVVITPDETMLYARHWAPAEAPRAIVVIMHGLKDHSARYADVATRLAAAGYSVYAFDLRGHGRSSGPRVAPARWFDYVDDLDRFLTSIESREPGRPVFLFGHSMGGAIAAATAIRHTPRLAGLILSAPALVVDAQPILLAATRMAGFLTPRAPALDLPNADFSSASGAKAALDADPLIHQAAGPARTAAGLLAGIAWIWGHVDGLTMPLLALHGTRDRLTAPAGSRELIRAAPSTDKTLRIYDGLFHDLLHEPRGGEVEADVLAWLDAHTGGAPVTPPPPFTGHLTGDPRGWTQAVAISAGPAFEDHDGGTPGFTDDVRFGGEVAIHLARPRPFGWSGTLTGRILGQYKVATLAPVGVAVSFRLPRGQAMTIGVATGASLMMGTRLAIPAMVWVETSLPPLHVTYRAEVSYSIGGDPPRRGPLHGDALWHGITVRIGGDRAYWPRALAGVGPTLSFAQTDVEGIRAFTIMAGLQLYGAD